MLALSQVDCLLTLLNFISSFRLRDAVRPFVFVAITKPAREGFICVFRATPEFSCIILSMGLLILSFVWFGFVLFGEGSITPFDSWSESVLALWTLFTTANYPDVMLTIYQKNHFSMIFFGVYIILTIFLFNNVLLATVYSAYKNILTERTRRCFENREEAIRHAFGLLASPDSGVIPQPTWISFLGCYSDKSFNSPKDWNDFEWNFHRAQSEVIFNTLDIETHGIDLEAFTFALELMLDNQIYLPCKPVRSSGFGLCRRTLSRIVRNGVWLPCFKRSIQLPWDSVVDVVIFLSFLVMLGETVGHMHGKFFGVIYWGIYLFYIFDLLAQIFVFGRERFFNKKPFQSRFDIFCVVALSVSTVAPLIMSSKGDFHWLSTFFRVLRALRLIQHVPPYKRLAKLCLALLPIYFQWSMVILIVFYIYASVGLQWFGGKLYEGNPALQDSVYSQSKYWHIHFNDFPSGLVTLFVLLVVNNWFIIADACVRTSSSWAYIFFVSFFIVANSIFVNILIALTLDCQATLGSPTRKEHISRQMMGKRVRLRDGLPLLRRMLLDDDITTVEAAMSASQVAVLEVTRRHNEVLARRNSCGQLSNSKCQSFSPQHYDHSFFSLFSRSSPSHSDN